MKTGLCVLLLGILLIAVPVFGEDMDPAAADTLRTGMTIAGAGIGLAAGSAIALGFSLDAVDTPLSNTLLLTIPVAAVGAATGALAGRWMADLALTHQPSPLWAVVEGAGLGAAAGAFVGALTFTVNFTLAYPILDVPEGYWGRFDYPQTVGLSVLAGGFWGGLVGLVAGAIALPAISLLLGF